MRSDDVFRHFVVTVGADEAQRALGDTSQAQRAEWTARSQVWVCAALAPYTALGTLLRMGRLSSCTAKAGQGIRWGGRKDLKGKRTPRPC